MKSYRSLERVMFSGFGGVDGSWHSEGCEYPVELNLQASYLPGFPGSSNITCREVSGSTGNTLLNLTVWKVANPVFRFFRFSSEFLEIGQQQKK